MNPKEKDELREYLSIESIETYAITKNQAEYLIKAIDHMEVNCSGCENHFKDSKDCPICKVYEHPQPLDAGDTEQYIKNRLAVRGFPKETITNNRGLIGATIEEMTASITAKQKAWEEEKSKLIKEKETLELVIIADGGTIGRLQGELANLKHKIKGNE